MVDTEVKTAAVIATIGLGSRYIRCAWPLSLTAVFTPISQLRMTSIRIFSCTQKPGVLTRLLKNINFVFTILLCVRLGFPLELTRVFQVAYNFVLYTSRSSPNYNHHICRILQRKMKLTAKQICQMPIPNCLRCHLFSPVEIILLIS